MRCLTCIPLCLSATFALAQEAPPVKKITANVTLEKGAVIRTPLVIAADNVTIDGHGATIQGPGEPGKLKTFVGAGISAQGRSGVTIRNLNVKGFESGLVADGGKEWTIEGCDFSDNYHDPDYGWGDGNRVGGIILTNLTGCTIRNNRANRVWNGLDLWESHDNTIERNDFSHCSNVCLKLWRACRNHVTGNNLSYGLRISPGEVHARDSTSVLIETGSDHNTFKSNDITHGGDGVFIRVLNGWCSRWNAFIENDCSYANNNGFESWSPDNTYLRNKANHCSYGFWLGGSDHTVLIGNEAAYNGQPDGFHNAPEPDFQHGGIVIVGGSGTHTLIDGNHCHHNNGAGIVFRGDLGTEGKKWTMYHLIVQNNRLENNQWGLFARWTDWLDLCNNQYKDNEKDEFLEGVTDVFRREPDPQHQEAPKAAITGPARTDVGQQVTFDASASQDPAGRPLQFRWEISGQEYTGAKVTHTFDAPGFYRVGLTVNNGHLAGLAFIDGYATRAVDEPATEGHANDWTFTMAGSGGKVNFTAEAKEAMVGKNALRVRPDPYTGADVTLIYPKSKRAGWDLSGKKQLSFWLRWENPNQGGFDGPNPIIRLHGGKAAFTYTPAYAGMPRNLLGDLPYSEARHGWLCVTMPLEGGENWLRSETLDGARPPHIDHGLKFITGTTPIETQSGSAMVSAGDELYCATSDGDRLFRRAGDKEWQELKSPARELNAQPAWINGMLAFYPQGGEKGRLYLHHVPPDKDSFGVEQPRLTAYDIATDTWSWVPTATIIGHGSAIVGDYIYGLAHAIGGNYGGPVCRVNLRAAGPMGERTVLAPVKGKDAWWFSRAAQLAGLNGLIYAIKNDWQTPQPKNADDIGDRLLVFDPQDFKASTFAGGHPWKDEHWKAANTPVRDLGPLPFEIGHGAALVALPPKWCTTVGAKGGLFIVAGCSPSNHEGFGPPSAAYAIYDVESGRFTVGTLPDTTGAGTSAALHRGVLYIKRGGMNYGPSNSEIWTVTPLTPEEAQSAQTATRRERMDLKRVDYIGLQFDSAGGDPFDVWIDGLAFE